MIATKQTPITTNTKVITRPYWMNDVQYAIYMEVSRLGDEMLEAMLKRERERWLKLSLRMREITRAAHDHMFRPEDK